MLKDEDQYMMSLGMARTSEIQRDARIGEAEANRDAQIETAIAEEQRLASRLLNDAEIERAKRDFELKKATYDAEVKILFELFEFFIRTKKSTKQIFRISNTEGVA